MDDYQAGCRRMKSTRFPAAYSGCRGTCGWYVFNSSSFFWTCHSEGPRGSRDTQAETLAGEIQDKTSGDISIQQSVQLSV